MRDLSARCRHCGWAFGRTTSPFRQASVSGEMVSVEGPPAKRRPGLPRPAAVNIALDEASGAVELSLATRQHILTPAPALSALGLVCILGSTLVLMDGQRWAALAAGLGVLVLAVGFAIGLRPTRLRIGLRDLEVRAPFFLRRGRTVPIGDIEQLYVDEVESPLAVERHYTLKAHLVGGGEVVLVGWMRSPIVALFLEQELERRMGIEDVPMPGEYERPSLATKDAG